MKRRNVNRNRIENRNNTRSRGRIMIDQRPIDSVLASMHKNTTMRGTVVNIYLLHIRGGEERRGSFFFRSYPIDHRGEEKQQQQQLPSLFLMLTHVRRASDSSAVQSRDLFHSTCPPSDFPLHLDRSAKNALRVIRAILSSQTTEFRGIGGGKCFSSRRGKGRETMSLEKWRFASYIYLI